VTRGQELALPEKETASLFFCRTRPREYKFAPTIVATADHSGESNLVFQSLLIEEVNNGGKAHVHFNGARFIYDPLSAIEIQNCNGLTRSMWIAVELCIFETP